MDSTPFSVYSVDDRSYVSYIKREIHNMLTQAGFGTTRTGEIDIIVSELASNLIKHADRGELLYRIAEEQGHRFFEIFCIDSGPGSNDIKRMMRDGISSSNTLGHGLGSIDRLSDFFQIYSMAGWGTVSVSRSYAERPEHKSSPRGPLYIRSLQACYPGEKICGDGYYIKRSESKTQILVGDGLGHGSNAHEAAQAAISAFRECTDSNPVDIIRFIDRKVKKTRGLVATIAVLDHAAETWNICGVGNISTRIYEGLEYKNYVPHNGIIGLNIPNTLNFSTIPVKQHQMIVMCSDGIRTRWDLMKYPSLLKHDPALISGVLFKDQARRTDDMTIVTAKVL